MDTQRHPNLLDPSPLLVYSKDLDLKINKRITDNNSTTAAELAAIDEAIKTIQEKKIESENIVILTDSLAATLSIKNPNKTNARQDLTESINIRANDLQEKNQTQVQICWIPAHCNIEGNEKADKQAKLGLSSKTRRKTGLGPSEVKSIINQYKNKMWQDMWTNNPKGRFFHAIAPQVDGSKKGSIVSLGVYSKDLDLKINKRITDNNSTTAAELAAIDEAIKTIQEKKIESENIVILTDSLAATLSIKNPNKTNARQDLTESINIRANDLQEKNQTQVQICWIPAHCNIEGNEKADKQAKLGLSSKTRRKTGLGPSEVKSIINQYKNKKWQDMWTNNPKGRFFHAIAPQTRRDRNQRKKTKADRQKKTETWREKE
ncbi:hypothetical protein EGW08_014077 [Elysia chlorotica]|uniref:ribonuclease H n=1 Tax=Elysia chlorotica TaxID=188477 RepID=A0A433T9E7_ELYCH|nr:hypothetical protein EGW08_014077 [Elysia chlorotica]